MRGYPLTERKAGLWSRLLSAEQLRMLLITGVLGVAVGLLMSQVRLHLGLPGHKALFWMIPIVTARLLTRCPVGVTAGTLATAFTSLAMGGHFAGGVVGLPAVGFAGILLDAVIVFAERRHLAAQWTIPLLAVGGALANLLCLFKRLAAPVGPNSHYLWNMSWPWADVASYAFFGFCAGLVGSGLATIARRRG